ncbi:MAG: tetratricopeptide (TPR) repeat protein [Bradymonadia bacterium]|jgi:tetratricopeptide (TPR) repeat protein
MAGYLGAGVGFGAAAALLGATSGVFGLVPLLAIYAGVTWWTVDRRRKAHDLVRMNDDAVALLNSGDVHRAAGIFEQLIASSRGVPAYHALFVYNRGVAFLRAGEFDRALSLFTAALSSGWLDNERMPFRPMIFSGMATAHALRGDIGAAQAWIRDAHAIISDAKRGALLPADVIAALRSGRPGDAIAMMDSGWASAEGVLSPVQLRALKLLRAFALEFGPANDVRDAEIQRLIDSVHPHPAGAFQYVGAAWPEFQAFLRRAGLTSF